MLRRLTASFAVLIAVSAGASAAETAAYLLEDVWLTPTQQLTGRFVWTYDPGDFENGVGTFTEIDIPWTGYGLESLVQSLEVSSLEVTLNGSVHDHGVDLYLALASDLAPGQTSELDLAASAYHIEVGISHTGVPLSGRVVPDLSNWIELGGALAGTLGAPQLAGDGALEAGQLVSLSVDGGLPWSTAHLVLGLSVLGAPFKGGTLVPDVDLLIAGLPLDGSGATTLSFVWPTGVPAGVLTVWQSWHPDAGGVFGYAASQAVSGTSL
jgi:hypothetical protein